MANSYVYTTPDPYSNITIDMSSANNALHPSTTYNYTAGAIGSGSSNNWLTSTSAATTNWTSGVSVSPSSTLEVKGNDADIVINGKSLTKFMETMESRLAILQPDLEKLEHFSALKKAYDHYKALEALCQLPEKDDENS